MSIVKGNDLILFHGASNKPLSRATSCNLEISRDELEITSKTSGDFKEFLDGKVEWSISVDGLVDFDDVDGFNVLNNIMLNGGTLDVAVGVAVKDPDSTKPTGVDSTISYYSGKVKVMSLSLNTGAAGEASTYSASLKGTGKLAYN